MGWDEVMTQSFTSDTDDIFLFPVSNLPAIYSKNSHAKYNPLK